MKKRSVVERIGIFIFSLIIANILVSLTPGLPDEILAVTFGIYEAVK